MNLTFLNARGLDSMIIDIQNEKEDIESLRKNHILFICETKLTKKGHEKFYKQRGFEVFENKDTFCSFADPANSADGRGCPSGGLEMISRPNLNAKLITESKYHLGIQFSDMCMIGIYYKPTLVKFEYELVIQDVLEAIGKAPTNMQCNMSSSNNQVDRNCTMRTSPSLE